MTKVYYISIKSGKKGPQPVETIATSEEEMAQIKTFLSDKGVEVNISEKEAETFNEYKNRYEMRIKREEMLKKIKEKLTPEEIEMLKS